MRSPARNPRNRATLRTSGYGGPAELDQADPSRVLLSLSMTARRDPWRGSPGHPIIDAPEGDPVMRLLLSHDAIQARVLEMGRQIAADYTGREPHLVGVLKGACTFMTDLARAMQDVPLTLDYIAVSSYGAATKTSGEVRLVKDLDQGLDGRHLLVVEDIV